MMLNIKCNLSFWHQRQCFPHKSWWCVTDIPELDCHQPSEFRGVLGHPWEQWLVSQSLPRRNYSPGRDLTLRLPCTKLGHNKYTYGFVVLF